MSRNVNINIGVNSSKAVSNINTLKKAFEELNKSIGKTADGKGKLKLDIDLSGVDIKSLRDVGNALKSINKYSNDFKDLNEALASTGKTFQIVNNHTTNYNRNMKGMTRSNKEFVTSMADVTIGMNFLQNTMRSLTTQYRELTNNTFGVGIAGQMDMKSIRELNDSFIQLSVTVPQSASELAKAVDDLIRTGRGYEESRQIIQEVAKLSTASGDSLKDTAQVVTKVMVSLGVNANRTAETLNTMHSTAIQTATDMKYLAEAYKNVAGTNAVFVTTTGLAGEQLDDYKQKILDFTMASIGSMGNLGLSASQAGTKIKQLFGRVTSAEKVAKNMFNSQMKLNNVMFDGDILNYDRLSNLAKKDLPKAVELMSKLYKNGQLSSEVLQKMFTARHFMEISDLLIKINGDVDGFTKGIASGLKYTDDTVKAMFNVNEQLKLAKNNLKAVFKDALETNNKSMTGFLTILNEYLTNDTLKHQDGSFSSETSKFLKELAMSAGQGTLAITSLGVAMKTLVPLFNTGKVALQSFMGAGSVGTLPITALITSLIYLTKQYFARIQELEEAVYDVGLAFRQLPSSIDKFDSSLKSTEGYMSNVLRLAEGISKLDYTKGIKDVTPLFNSLTESQKDYFDIVENIGSLNAPNTKLLEYSLEPYNEIVNQQKSLLADMEKQYDETIKNITEKSMRNLNPSILKPNKASFGYDSSSVNKANIENEKRQINVVRIYNTYLNLIKDSKKDLKEVEQEIVKMGESLGISENAVKQIINSIDTKPMAELKDKAEEYESVLNKTQDTIKNITAEQTKQAELAELINNKMIALDVKHNLNRFKATGEIEVSGVKFKGLDALDAIAKQQMPTIAENMKNELEAQLEKRQVELAKLVKDRDNGVDINLDNLKAIEEEVGLIGKKIEKIGKVPVISINQLDEGTKEILKNLNYTEASAGKVFALLDTLNRLLIERNTDGNPQVIAFYERMAEYYSKELKYESEVERARKNSNKYKLKYINFQKEEYEIELALAKLGKTKGEQAYLEYEYKLKTLDVNKKLAEVGIQDSRKELSKLRKGEGSDLIGQILNTNTKDTLKLQELAREFTSRFPKEMIGDRGKDIKEKQDAIIQYIKTVYDAKKIEKDLSVTIIDTINNTMDYIAQTNPYSTLMEGSYRYMEDFQARMNNIFESNKQKVWDAYKLNDMSIDDAVVSSYKAMVGLQQAISTENGKRQIMSLLNIKNEEELSKLLIQTKQRYEDISKIKSDSLDKDRKELELARKKLEVYNNMATLLGKVGSTFNLPILNDLENAINSFADMKSFSLDTNNSFDLSKAFEKGFNNIDFSTLSMELSKAFENATKHFASGQSIGSVVGSITGGGVASQQAGALAGLATGFIPGLDPVTSLGIQAGASLLGGLLGDSGMSKEEADRKTKEANKIYNKNTEALQKLSQNMSNLSGGIDGLNNTLISSFSKIPTVGNLDKVTNAMTDLYKTMDKTRIFNNVAYQVTKTKKGKKGFLGFGGSAGTTWTETIEVTVQEMLHRYGFNGGIEQMTSQQIRDFSKWLKDFNMGDSDNFSVLAEALEDYAEGLDKFDKNIQNFFKDSTLESFVGISSLEQEALRQQIEDFYKNLGLQIDEETSKQIDKLAEEMSVMVTVMNDVRGEFINSWRNSGLDAGKAFLSSMRPYIDAMLNNLSQIYYDVYFSDVNEKLEEEFKALSEKLVELKKQGQNLDWNKVAGELSGSFDKVIEVINATKNETESFNTILQQLQQQAFESGLSLSEIFDLGLVTGTQQTVIDTFRDALGGNEAESAFTSIGSMVGDTIGKALVDKMIDNMMGDKILEMSAMLDKVVSGSLNFDSLLDLANQSMSVGLMMENESKRIQAIKDLFNWDKGITYENQNNTVEYQSGTSQSVVNNYYINGSVEAGAVIESDSVERLLDAVVDTLIEKLRVEKGIDLRKLQ